MTLVSRRFATVQPLATVGLLLCLFAPAGAAPAASTTPPSGPPTTSTTLKGSGFDASTLIDVYLDTTEIALTSSNAAGAVSVGVTIPAETQPGTHWLTVAERKTDAAAQAAFLVRTDWTQAAFGPSKRSFNPYENTINTGNVAKLTRAWSRPLDDFSNAKPFIVPSNRIVTLDGNRTVRTFDLSGTLLWTATLSTNGSFTVQSPAAFGGDFFFTGPNGDVVAYKYDCRSDGGVCTPLWTQNIGSVSAGGITVRNGLLYVSAADGKVHVLKPANGAALTSIAFVGTDALTSWPAFVVNGTVFGVEGTRLEGNYSDGAESNAGFSATLSAPAVAHDAAYFTEADAILRQFGGWSIDLSGGGCATPPVFANNVIYAAGCTSVGAYDSGDGTTLWSVTTPGFSAGLVYANGVLYGCMSNVLVAYAASNGGKLWTGGHCSSPPVVVNGVLYAAYGDISAYTLSGAQTTARVMARPDPRKLKPTLVSSR